MIKNNYPGTLVALEGIDGSGTTSTLNAIWAGFDAVKTSEPAEHLWTGKMARKAINDHGTHPMTDFHCFLADRASHLKHTIVPALDRGELVITDRYALSTLAYQQENLAMVVDNPRHYIEDAMMEWVIKPDLTLLLDLPESVAAKRRAGTDKYEESDFQRRVRQNYLELADDLPDIRVIDATQDEYSVHNQVKNQLYRL